MAASQLLNKLKQLDAYPKINEDFYSRTLSGGLITIAAAIFMVLLFFTELRRFPSPGSYESFVFYLTFF